VKLTRFSAKGYRSLRDITLDGLGDFNIFYGPNGSGKSNVLDALQTFFAVLPLAVETAFGPDDDRLSFRDAGNQASAYIRDDDLFMREDTRTIAFSAILSDVAHILFHGQPVDRIDIEVHYTRIRPGAASLQIKRLLINGQKPGLPFHDPETRDVLRLIVPQAFTHLGVTRTLTVNAFRDAGAARPRSVGTIPDGEVVRMLFEAKNSSDRKLRERFDQVREFMAKTLHRGAFDVFMDAEKNLELREQLPEPNPRGVDIRLDNAGHGVVQMYAIIATILLAGGRLVAIEEPEAHLHAPTLGRELRTVLQSLVAEGRVHQFFIATHSNLFDLDLTGYWDVSLVDGESVIKRQPLDEVDRLHLFEPGPAKHQLQELLRLYGDEVVFRTRDGQPLTMQDMLVSLQNDDDIAKSFLDDLHAAAMQVTGLRARRRKNP
jgi:predicted ATPase